MIYRENEPTPAARSEIASKDNKLYHVFRFLEHEYSGDITKFLKALNSFLALDITSKYIKNKKIKFLINSFKYGIPAFIYGSEFYLRLKRYIEEIQNDKSPVYQKRIAKLAQLLDVPSSTVFDCKTAIGVEIILWLLTRPDTKLIKIMDFYDENINELKTIASNENSIIYVLFEYENERFVLDIEISLCLGQKFIERIFFISSSKNIDDKEIELRRVFMHEFISSLNTSKNILHFRGAGSIQCKQRTKVEEKINQFDVESLIKEIDNVLDCGRKRAYAFVSRPGTGKSTILRKIEEVMTNRVIFKLSPSDFAHAETIKDRFAIIKKIPGSIVIIEDLDSCDLADKNSKTGVFLDEIDDSNDLNLIIFVTINDTCRVHFSIINRPGRFDKVIEIKSPQNINEIYEVILSKTKKLKPNYFENTSFQIPPREVINELLDECLKEKFTQAEITDAIVEQILIDIKKEKCDWNSIESSLFKEFFRHAIDAHKQTLEALKNCNFKNTDPNSKRYSGIIECEDKEDVTSERPKLFNRN